MRQGDTTTVLIRFSADVSDKDIKVGVYNEQDQEMYAVRLLDTGSPMELIGENTYRIVIPHTVTKNWVGKYYLDILVKNASDTDYVNVGETSVKLNFKAAKIATNL